MGVFVGRGVNVEVTVEVIVGDRVGVGVPPANAVPTPAMNATVQKILVFIGSLVGFLRFLLDDFKIRKGLFTIKSSISEDSLPKEKEPYALSQSQLRRFNP
jgi:hypothetical protein